MTLKYGRNITIYICLVFTYVLSLQDVVFRSLLLALNAWLPYDQLLTRNLLRKELRMSRDSLLIGMGCSIPELLVLFPPIVTLDLWGQQFNYLIGISSINKDTLHFP